ncbi:MULTISPECIES: conserved phage C-terminal domain-containing protein [unclassified Clostridioides]|uniref:conserved phage C-terminal domain-containing protein n=1 Tax=unclassified Clostridioides TaxID=2635829 RepID=UPI0038A3BA0F
MELLKDSRKKEWFWIENSLIDNLDLSTYEKMIYIVLVRHLDDESTCFPKKSTIAKEAGCSEATVKRTINSLEEKKLIKRVFRKDKKTGSNTSNLYYVASSKLGVHAEPRFTQNPGGAHTEPRGGSDRPANNTHINNTQLTNNIYSPAEQKEGKTNDKEAHKRIIDYLNEKADKSFKSTTKKTRDLINARLKEGFVEEDFYKAIDNKVHTWLEDAKMNIYLRPETIFGNKFESYLNEVPRMAKNGNESVKQNKEVSKNKFANFEQTFTQYSNKELDEIIKKSQKAKFEK